MLGLHSTQVRATVRRAILCGGICAHQKKRVVTSEGRDRAWLAAEGCGLLRGGIMAMELRLEETQSQSSQAV